MKIPITLLEIYDLKYETRSKYFLQSTVRILNHYISITLRIKDICQWWRIKICFLSLPNEYWKGKNSAEIHKVSIEVTQV